MVNDKHSSAGSRDSEGRKGFPARLAELIGDSSVRGFARKAGVSDTFLRQCLAGRTEPTRTKLIALAGAGDTSVEWLATGHGTRDGITAPGINPRASGLDRTLLESVIASVEEVLGETRRTVSPQRKALLIASLYDMRAGCERGPISREEVLRLVSGAA